MELNPSNETTTTESSVNYSTGSSTIPTETSTAFSTTATQTSTQSNDNPIGIKIKEITKPEEIRITDDRPKVFKPVKSSEVITPKASSELHSMESLIEPEHESSPSTIQDELSEIQSEIEPEIEQHTTFTFDDNADQPIQLESTDLNTVGHVSMGPKIVRQTDIGLENEIHTTIAPFSAENEIKDEILTTGLDHVTDGPIESSSVKHNTSVLQVGDSVVIFDRSGQTQSIPLRVAGLQRGEDTYDEEDERKEGRKTDETEQYSTTESESSSFAPIFEQSTSTSTEVFEVYYYEPKDMSTLSLDFPTVDGSGEGFSGETKLNEEGSAELHNADTSTEKLLEDIENSSGYSSLDRFTDPMLAQQSTVDEKTMSYFIEGSSSTSEEMSTSFDNLATSTSSSQLYSSEPTITDADDDIVQHDQNINFPHITDDLSIHGSRIEDRMEDEEKLRVNSRIVEGELEKIENVPLEENSIITNEDLNKSQDFSTSTIATLADVKETTNFKDIEGRSPGEPLLIPEWERNQTTVAPIELLLSNETEDHSLAEISSHDNHVVDDDVGSTTSEPDLSSSTSSTDFIDTNLSTSESGYEVESIETHSTSGPSQVRETNNLKLFLDGTADFFRIQKKVWNSDAV